MCVLCLAPQSCPTLCSPMDCSPPGSSVHGDSPGKNTGVGCHALLQAIFPTQGSNPGLPNCRQIIIWASRELSIIFLPRARLVCMMIYTVSTRWLRGKESTRQFRGQRRCRVSPWVRRTPWRRKRQPTPIFLTGKSHGERSLAGYSPWGRRVGHDWAHTHEWMARTSYWCLTHPSSGSISQWTGKWKLLSHVLLFAIPWTIQSIEFSRPEYWSR